MSEPRPATITPIRRPPRPGDQVPTRAPLLREVYGRLLRQGRRDQGRTLADVSSAAGVSLPYLSEVERGLKEPSSEVLEALCAALGATVADLLGAAHRDLTSRRELTAHRERAVQRELSASPVRELRSDRARAAAPPGGQALLLAA